MAANNYGIKIRILGNEVFAIELESSDSGNRWIALGLVTLFSFIVLVSIYGERLVEIFK